MKRVPVEVTGISVCPPYQGYMLILRELQGNRWLPIFIGQSEAQNITYILKGSKLPRPLTFDLFGSLIEGSGARVDAVTVTELRDGTFFAEITLQTAAGALRGIDARPSDAVALALKTRAPVFVAERVLDEAGQSEELNIGPSEHGDRLRELNQQLHEAVEKEAYEKAARLRDQIRALEGQGRTGKA